VIHIPHDPERADDDKKHDQNSEGESERVVGIVRRGRDVQG
jgi:hypothetical protein